MLAKDIAQTLDGTWEEVSNSTLFPHATTRIRIIVEKYQPNYVGVFIPENEDYIESDKDFINEFQKTIGMQLCADQEIKLIESLADNLNEWAKHLEPSDNTVATFLQNLLDKHNNKMSK